MTTYTVSSGVVSSGITLNSGDIETVLSGGTAISTTINSGGSETLSGGLDHLATIKSGGSLTVLAGGRATSDTINSGGLLTLSSGGRASNDTINSGGTEIVSGVPGSATVGGSATSETIFGSLIVSSGGSASNDTIRGGGSETVLGSATSDTINSGGYETVMSDGFTSFTTINSGGLLTLSFNGRAISTTVNNGGSELLSFGFASASTINNGGTEIVVSGSTTSGDTINSGGLLVVSSLGDAQGVMIGSGGSETVLSNGFASFDTISGGGSVTESNGGFAHSETINGGGLLTVSSGGAVEETVIFGSLIVSSGGLAENNGTIFSGGLMTVLGGGSGNATTISNGGLLTVSSGGLVDVMMIASGGIETVSSGGTTSRDTVESGGSLIVSSGGSTILAMITGGSETVLAGGGASFGTVSSGALLIVSSGGTATGTLVETGGSEIVFGTDINDLDLLGTEIVSSGGIASLIRVAVSGSLTVLAGGTASSTTVFGSVFGGGVGGQSFEIVSSGGTTVSPTISGSGAVLELLTGAVASGGISFAGSGGQLQIGGTTMPSTTISGVVSGDTFDLLNVPFDNSARAGVVSGNLLEITESAGTFQLTLAAGDYSSDTFPVTNDASTSGTLITVTPLCFCHGTLIETERGEVPVERLAVGDRLKTLSGAMKPVRWIGFGRDLVTARHSLARPIVVRAGALADGEPRRDLYLTHGHALYLAGVLIPVENLVNHRSIRWDEEARVVEYYHVELEDHAVLFAEGAPAETYYDADNRAKFHNTRPGSTAGASASTFAPVLNGGDLVDKVWAALYARAGGNIETGTTDDPDLHLVVDGKRLDPASTERSVYTFALEQRPASSVLLASRSGAPSLMRTSRHDHRRLGVAISRIGLSQPGIVTAFEHAAPLFAEGGCYPPEPENGYCWTDGEFELPARLFAHLTGPFTISVHIERPGMRYPAPVALAEAA